MTRAASATKSLEESRAKHLQVEAEVNNLCIVARCNNLVNDAQLKKESAARSELDKKLSRVSAEAAEMRSLLKTLVKRIYR